MVGDKIDYQVGYGDATVFLHDIIYGLRNQKLEKVWKIQGRGKTAWIKVHLQTGEYKCI